MRYVVRMTTQTVGRQIPAWTMGDRLRKAREAAGLEQQELADEIDVSRGTISNYEKDRVDARKIVLKAWAMRCNVDLDWLETGKQNAPHPDGDGGQSLPRLDLNQEPSVYQFPQVSALRTAA